MQNLFGRCEFLLRKVCRFVTSPFSFTDFFIYNIVKEGIMLAVLIY